MCASMFSVCKMTLYNGEHAKLQLKRLKPCTSLSLLDYLHHPLLLLTHFSLILTGLLNV